MGVEVTDFEQQVIERSREIPVVADFWAPWCGPCQVLGPALERAEAAAGGKWELAKVNVDQHGPLSSREGIRSIPEVRLYIDGEHVDRFVGALPEHSIVRWVEDRLPTEEKEQLKAALALAHAGDTDAAAQSLEEILAAQPEQAEAALALARIVLPIDPQRALELVEGVKPGVEGRETADEIGMLAGLLLRDPAELPEANAKALFSAALKALREGDYDEALRAFIDSIIVDKSYEDEAARKACVALFHLLGEGHETSKKYRKRFGMALY